MSQINHRILSLDGGGSWALIQARTLEALYPEQTGHQILKHFDLVAANSGGSIVAAGLFCDMRPAEIAALFETEALRKKIFVKRAIHPPGVLRYKAAEKLKGLEAIMQWRKGSPAALPEPPGFMTLTALGDHVERINGKRTDLLIASYDYDRQRATFFRSNANSLAAGTRGQPQPTLAQAVHASSNAPIVYFDRPAEFRLGTEDRRFWDGGVAAFNNPVLAAVTEFLCNQPGKAQELAALSIGTANVVLPVENYEVGPPLAEPKVEPGLIGDTKRMATAVLADPPDAASFMAYIMMGHDLANSDAPQRLVRMNPLIRPCRNPDGTWTPPPGYSLDAFERLCKLDMDAIEDDEVRIIADCCTAWMNNHIENQPLRASSKIPLGPSDYDAAFAAWTTLC